MIPTESLSDIRTKRVFGRRLENLEFTGQPLGIPFYRGKLRGGHKGVRLARRSNRVPGDTATSERTDWRGAGCRRIGSPVLHCTFLFA